MSLEAAQNIFKERRAVLEVVGIKKKKEKERGKKGNADILAQEDTARE